jgi:glycosyltransferase involved in cell wall biosynthesis
LESSIGRISEVLLSRLFELKRKIAIIGANGLPAKYGGFETLTHYLVVELARDFNITVYCSNLNKDKRIKSFMGATLIHLPLSANGIQGILYDTISIIHALFTQDTLLILGSSGTIILPVNFLFRKNIVFNFGGLDWQRAKWNVLAKWYLKLSEALGVKYSNDIIVDNSVFKDYVSEEYKKMSVIIEYGGDHVIKEVDYNFLRKYNLQGKEYFLSVSRAQEDNNIHILLNAFNLLSNKTLAVISNWGISEYGKKLKEMFQDRNNIILIDAIYDQKELDSIRAASYCYIHTHSACGSAPSLIEAMNLGLPIISFDVPANRATTQNKALFFRDEHELIHLIQNLDDGALQKMKIESENIARECYKWSIICKKYRELF